MAKFSSRVQNALDTTKHLLGSFVHVPMAVSAVQNRAYQGFDLATAQAYFGQLKQTLVQVGERLQAAEDAYTAEQSDDPELFAKRDASLAHALGIESECYQLFKGQVDPSLVKAYGLDGPRPKLPSDLLTRLDTVAKLLSKRPVKLRNGFGPDVESEVIAARLTAVATDLRVLESAVASERHELREALLVRDEALALWNDTYQGVAAQCEGLFRLASYKRLADAVRPTNRRARGLESAETLPPIPANPTDPDPQAVASPDAHPEPAAE